jgi:hypothetical protein
LLCLIFYSPPFLYIPHFLCSLSSPFCYYSSFFFIFPFLLLSHFLYPTLSPAHSPFIPSPLPLVFPPFLPPPVLPAIPFF